MNFEHVKSKEIKGETFPAGSDALTARQLGLLRFRKEEVEITDEEYLTIVIAITGQDKDNQIPFAKVADVLGGLDKLGDYKKQRKSTIDEI